MNALITEKETCIDRQPRNEKRVQAATERERERERERDHLSK